MRMEEVGVAMAEGTEESVGLRGRVLNEMEVVGLLRSRRVFWKVGLKGRIMCVHAGVIGIIL